MKKELKIIEISPDGNPNWIGGAYTFAFLYTKFHGNLLIKGYGNEVETYIEKNYTHYFVNYCLWSDGKHRDIWKFWKKNIGIFNPNRKKSKYCDNCYKWKIREYSTWDNQENGKEICFRRLPKRWIKQMDEF
jgi:hypothetical protein